MRDMSHRVIIIIVGHVEFQERVRLRTVSRGILCCATPVALTSLYPPAYHSLFNVHAGTETTKPQIPDNTVMHDSRMGWRLAFPLPPRAHVMAYSVLINVSSTIIVVNDRT
jgi:hypothetical protein